MIVFCDGCNTPYHRYCHQPVIDQAVVDEVDREWYCKQCEKERVLPVPESEVANFISAEGAPLEQVSRGWRILDILLTFRTETKILRESTAWRARHASYESDHIETGSTCICA